jgi:hypothetical protein
MKDQLTAKALTNSFIYSHSQKLIIGLCFILAILGAYYFESAISFAIMIGSMTIVSYVSWVVGRGQGFEEAPEVVLSSLVELGFLDRTVENGESIILKIEDLVYFDKCTKCDCGGLILNPSATKGHKTNEGKNEELECS